MSGSDWGHLADIKPLRGNEAIRKRPGMYVGPLEDPTLASRLILEGCCMALDSAKKGEVTEIVIDIKNDFTATIKDNGPGWEMYKYYGGNYDKPWPVVLMTSLFACKEAKLDAEAEGFCQMGIAVTCALSACSSVTIHRDEKQWEGVFKYGEYQGYEERYQVRNLYKNTGTELLFVLDTGLIKNAKLDAGYIKETVKKYACAYDCDIKVVDHRKDSNG